MKGKKWIAIALLALVLLSLAYFKPKPDFKLKFDFGSHPRKAWESLPKKHKWGLVVEGKDAALARRRSGVQIPPGPPKWKQKSKKEAFCERVAGLKVRKEHKYWCYYDAYQILCSRWYCWKKK